MNSNINFVLKSCDGIPSGAEARQLSRDYRAGDQSARDRLITGNMPMVSKMIQGFRVPPMLMDDAFEEGMIGLMRAIEVYDPDHPSGAGFSTVAYWWIMHYIQGLLKRESRHREHETTVGFAIEVEIEHVFFVETTAKIDTGVLLGQLSKREQHSLQAIMGNVSQVELAAEMGVTKQRVQQIKAGALDKLRGMVR